MAAESLATTRQRIYSIMATVSHSSLLCHSCMYCITIVLYVISHNLVTVVCLPSASYYCWSWLLLLLWWLCACFGCGVNHPLSLLSVFLSVQYCKLYSYWIILKITRGHRTGAVHDTLVTVSLDQNTKSKKSHSSSKMLQLICASEHVGGPLYEQPCQLQYAIGWVAQHHWRQPIMRHYDIFIAFQPLKCQKYYEPQ